MNIVITGASTGIGAATARELANGNTLILHYNSSKDAAESVAQDVIRAGGTVHLMQADLRSEAGCRALAGEIAAATDTIDVLVNNAGGLVRRQNCEAYEWALFQEIFALNTFQAMMMTHLCLPMLGRAKAPVVIFLTSVAARTGAPTATIYGASKGALDTLTRGLATELGPHIRVNAVAPGVIETPFHDKVTTPDAMERFANAATLKKNGQAQSIAQAIRFLIEDEFMTGATIDVNGGMNMR